MTSPEVNSEQGQRSNPRWVIPQVHTHIYCGWAQLLMVFDEFCRNLLWKDEKITQWTLGQKSTFAATVFVGTLGSLEALSDYQVISEHFEKPAHVALYYWCCISKDADTAIHWYESITSVEFVSLKKFEIKRQRHKTHEWNNILVST